MADHTLSGRLATMVADGPPGLPLAHRACQALRDLLGADGASVTLENPTIRRVTWGTTDERAEKLENLQDVLGEGPCREAFTSQRPVSTAMSRTAASRWPRYIPAAEQILGPRAVVWSLPMRVTDTPIGTISAYRLDGKPLAEPLDAAQMLADAAALMLLTDPATREEVPGAGPWAIRAVVHQAVGTLMIQLGTGAEDALAVLRAHAFTAGTQLAEVARAVLDGTVDLSGR
jgi:ANTAR domain-containing protein/GAF domain-containing protein